MTSAVRYRDALARLRQATRPHVLVVDSDLASARRSRAAYERASSVATQPDLALALEHLREWHVDLVVLGAREANGSGFAAALREVDPDVAILAAEGA